MEFAYHWLIVLTQDQVKTLLQKISTFKRNATVMLSKNYKHILRLMEKNVCSQEIKDEVTTEYGDLEKLIAESIKDIKDESCPIVITGKLKWLQWTSLLFVSPLFETNIVSI